MENTRHTEKTETMSNLPTYTLYVHKIDIDRFQVMINKSIPFGIDGPFTETEEVTETGIDEFVFANGFAYAPTYLRVINPKKWALELLPA